MPSMSMLLSSKQQQIHRWVLLSCARLDHETSKKANEEMGGGGGGEGGWSSTYSLSGPSKSPVKAVDMSRSVAKASPPPATKRAIHGKKNLAMCTETLGCETGVVYPVDEFDADTENGRAGVGRPKEEVVVKRSKRKSTRTVVPPPLTTLSGASRRRILSKRENGRLLLLLVKPSAMEAERTDGRLRLRFYRGTPFHSKDKVEQLENEEVKEEEEEGEKEEGEEEEEEEEEEGYLGVVGTEMNELLVGRIWGLEGLEGLVGVRRKSLVGTEGRRVAAR